MDENVLLVLQKLSKNSKVKDHCLKGEERMKFLQEGHILDIIKDPKLIQRRLVASKRQTTNDISKRCAKLMLAGKVKTALKLLTTECDNRVHEVNDEIISDLEEKYSKHNTLLYGPIENLLPKYFDSIDEGTIFKAACLTKGACGPSHMDADQF